MRVSYGLSLIFHKLCKEAASQPWQGLGVSEEDWSKKEKEARQYMRQGREELVNMFRLSSKKSKLAELQAESLAKFGPGQGGSNDEDLDSDDDEEEVEEDDEEEEQKKKNKRKKKKKDKDNKKKRIKKTDKDGRKLKKHWQLEEPGADIYEDALPEDRKKIVQRQKRAAQEGRVAAEIRDVQREDSDAEAEDSDAEYHKEGKFVVQKILRSQQKWVSNESAYKTQYLVEWKPVKGRKSQPSWAFLDMDEDTLVWKDWLATQQAMKKTDDAGQSLHQRTEELYNGLLQQRQTVKKLTSAQASKLWEKAKAQALSEHLAAESSGRSSRSRKS